jgi:maltose alpha-D-glucosyltransferase/alpha-amylase
LAEEYQEEEEPQDPLWYKDAIIYEVHVKAFYDTAGDGIGDFKGLTQKLDYLKDLGVTAIWLLPFFPSPLKDDGYDIADYFNVHPLYGVLNDFKDLLREAHARGIKVIIELVMNHTSDQHPWFKKSRSSPPGTDWRNLYVWSDTPDKYKEARIIFKDFETSNWAWDPVAKQYYWHRFYSHQPDLNYDNPLTEKWMFEVLKFWMDMGVDGVRLDAIPYLYEREGTNCENLPETHALLKKLRYSIDSSFKNRMLLAEANQWPTDAAEYFGNGNECNMAFHFPLMPRMFMAIQMEDRFPIIEILDQTPKIPDNSQWAIFLRNHDELTLEMVTDEERDYMYRVYAKDKQSRINLGIRRRLAPLLDNDRRKIELMYVLLFTLPGTPVIYYGDEIGMGDNFYLGDRNGVRTPMQWSADLNAGFSKTNPQKLYLPVIIEPKYHYEAINVENQQNDPASLLWWVKHAISIRKRYKAFGRGTIEFLYPTNAKVIAYLRKYKDEVILVAINLSGRPQSTELDLSSFRDYQPRDVFGGSVFPQIGLGSSSYRMTFGPYGYYVFSLTKKVESIVAVAKAREIPEIRVQKRIESLFEGRSKDKLETEIFPSYLQANRWFGGKGREIDRIRIRDIIQFFPEQQQQQKPSLAAEGGGGTQSSNPQQYYYVVLLDVYYNEGLPEAYLIPMSYSPIDISNQLSERSPQAVIAKVGIDKNTPGVIYDAMYDETFRGMLPQLILSQKVEKGREGEILGNRTPEVQFDSPQQQEGQDKSILVSSEQSNTSVIYGSKAILKLFRRVEEGKNPEVEIGQLLTKQKFQATPKLIGYIQYKPPGAENAVIGVLEEFVRNEGNAWSLFTGEFERFLERTTRRNPSEFANLLGLTSLEIEESSTPIPEALQDLITAPFIEKVTLLGKRTAEFHLALLSERDDPDFVPEPFGYLEAVATSQSMISHANRVFQQAFRAPRLTDKVRLELDVLSQDQSEIIERLKALRRIKATNLVRSRTHGDYHLGQVLNTGKDFVIIDYEGEPARSLDDRRSKRLALRDVAGMLRSFDYAAHAHYLEEEEQQQNKAGGGGAAAKAEREAAANREEWAELWATVVGAIFLHSYLKEANGSQLVPSDKNALSIILDAYLLEKSIYELSYELNNRPDWVGIPIKGIKNILRSSATTTIGRRLEEEQQQQPSQQQQQKAPTRQTTSKSSLIDIESPSTS